MSYKVVVPVRSSSSLACFLSWIIAPYQFICPFFFVSFFNRIYCIYCIIVELFVSIIIFWELNFFILMYFILFIFSFSLFLVWFFSVLSLFTYVYLNVYVHMCRLKSVERKPLRNTDPSWTSPSSCTPRRFVRSLNIVLKGHITHNKEKITAIKNFSNAM